MLFQYNISGFILQDNSFPKCFNFKIVFGADTEKENRSVPRKGKGLQSASVKTSRYRPKQRRISASMQVHSTALTLRLRFKAYWLRATTNLTFKNYTFCSHSVHILFIYFFFCIYLRTNNNFCPI